LSQYGETVFAERVKRRKNQREVAKRFGIYIQTLVDIEHCRIGIDEPTYRRLLEVIKNESKAAG